MGTAAKRGIYVRMKLLPAARAGLTGGPDATVCCKTQTSAKLPHSHIILAAKTGRQQCTRKRGSGLFNHWAKSRCRLAAEMTERNGQINREFHRAAATGTAPE